jgi:hypothetical protein
VILKTILRVAVVVEGSKAGLEMVRDLWIPKLGCRTSGGNKLSYMTIELSMDNLVFFLLLTGHLGEKWLKNSYILITTS